LLQVGFEVDILGGGQRNRTRRVTRARREKGGGEGLPAILALGKMEERERV
jgi:hypothetical protein